MCKEKTFGSGYFREQHRTPRLMMLPWQNSQHKQIPCKNISKYNKMSIYIHVYIHLYIMGDFKGQSLKEGWGTESGTNAFLIRF